MIVSYNVKDMKTYVLKKELPLIPEGTVFNYSKGGDNCFYGQRYLKEGKLKDYAIGDRVGGDAYTYVLDTALREGGWLERVE